MGVGEGERVRRGYLGEREGGGGREGGEVCLSFRHFLEVTIAVAAGVEQARMVIHLFERGTHFCRRCRLGSALNLPGDSSLFQSLLAQQPGLFPIVALLRHKTLVALGAVCPSGILICSLLSF